MSVMSEKEKNGCRRLLELLPVEDLLALKDTVTNRLISVESPSEAIEAIVAYSQSAEELLKRRKVHRDIIFKYLAKEGVAAPPNTEKLHLIWRALALWSSDNVIPFQDTLNDSSACCSEGPDGLADLTALGKEFCRWFFQLLNSLNHTAGQPVQDWGPQHFWGDVRLFILSYTGEQQRDEYHGAELVSRRLSALVWEEKLVFCPNLEHSGLKCLSTPHGLVLVAVAGTIHRENVCLGIFEQVFGLIRDPLDGNRWKMKFVHLKIKGQLGAEQLPVLTYESNDMLQLFTT
ncbi:uncharacterized protein C3orf38 homolog [Salminus brasiliensis]|uniref:uncharacterized protein C3orf38 homolog n=1 Tax=Salminus brasiliensis TaxID=930266 RepID=UPI003B839F0F